MCFVNGPFASAAVMVYEAVVGFWSSRWSVVHVSQSGLDVT